MADINFLSVITTDDYELYEADLSGTTTLDNIGAKIEAAAGANPGINGIEPPLLDLTASLDKLWLVLPKSDNSEESDKNDKRQYAIIVELSEDVSLNIIDSDKMGKIGDLVSVELAVALKRVVYSHNLAPDTSDGPVEDIFDNEHHANAPDLTWPVGFTSGIMGEFTFTFDEDEKPLSLFYNHSNDADEDGEDDGEEEDGGEDDEAADSREDGENVSIQQRTPEFSLDSLAVKFSLQAPDGSLAIKIGIVLDASIQMGPLTGKIIQFEVDLDFSDTTQAKSALQIHLKGLGVGYDSPPISIAGALVQNGDDLDGGLAIGITEWTMTVLAAIGTVPLPSGDGAIPSIFLYGYLGGELINIEGICSLNGIAATIGFNRQLKPPSDLSLLGDHPFIKAAAADPEHPTKLKDLLKEVNELGNIVPASLGDFFFGLGLKGELVELISLFVLPVISIDLDLSGATPTIQDVNLQIYGLGSVGLPEDAPVVQIDIALLGAFSLLHGNVLIGASLTDRSGITIIPDNNMRLSGSAAFYFNKDQKTFVVTAGGYGPLLTQNPDWPTMSPISLSWKPSKELNMSAAFYFALVPKAIALGFKLDGDGTFDIDVASGGYSFDFSLDAIIQWRPLYFEADLSASFSFYINTSHSQHYFDIQADVDLWGQKAVPTDDDPNPHHLTIGGSAKLHVHAFVHFTFKVKFGADKAAPPIIGWEDFKKKFLPTDQADQPSLASLKVTQGQITVPGIPPDQNRIVIAPGRLELQAEGFLPPTNGITFMGTAVADSRATGIGVQMAGYTTAVYESTVQPDLRIDIQATNADGTALTEHTSLLDRFEHTLLSRSLPAALWKPANERGVAPGISPNEPDTIADVPTGLVIKVAEPSAGNDFTFQKSLFAYSPTEGNGITLTTVENVSISKSSTLAAAADSMVAHRLDRQLLEALGITDTDSLGTLSATDLLGDPYLI